MVDGTTLKDADFTDEFGNKITVNLSVRDIILFRLLEKIAKEIKNQK